ncbi:MAG: terpene cyclase/mutase family protein [Planctomycetes bacterium]|nr:terpene cyclase/mutase family protein [Planctomycetota bacterium]
MHTQSQPASRPGDERSAAGRKRRVEQLGGTIDTENAVEAGLIWLAAHQEPDGIWDRVDFRRHCPEDSPCPGPALYRRSSDLTPGVTGLCLLAFLGAGYTDQAGPHADTVRRAVAALLRMQQPDGGFSADESMAGYNNAIATLALAEFYSLTSEPLVAPALEKAIDRIVLTQQPLGGWDYLPRASSGRNDTSITGWMVQALQACVAAGMKVPPRAFIGAALHIDRATESDGRTWYADAGIGLKLEDQNNDPDYRYGPAMIGVGLMARQLLGWRPDQAMVRKQSALILGELPSVARMKQGDPTELHDYYYWYYGTLAAFRVGGDAWPRWNNALRDAVLPLQEREKNARGVKSHSFGSFPSFAQGWGRWGRSGGRVYATAINVLTLEIYYRHSPAYLDEPAAVTASDWREYLRGVDARTLAQAIPVLGQLRLEIGEPVLVELLDLSDQRLALAAALELARLDSPAGRAVLDASKPDAPPLQREQIERSLRRLDELKRQPVRGKVRMVDPAARLATLDFSPAWVGQTVRTKGTDEPPVPLRVVQRFTDSPIVVAEWLADSPRPPQPGEDLGE